ncbi:MAG: GAF domain-containing protein [Chloroflexota bacterium]
MLGLGERLLALAQRAVGERISAQQLVILQGAQILEAARALIDGQVSLWLDSQIIRPYIPKEAEKPLLFTALEARPGFASAGGTSTGDVTTGQAPAGDAPVGDPPAAQHPPEAPRPGGGLLPPLMAAALKAAGPLCAADSRTRPFWRHGVPRRPSPGAAAAPLRLSSGRPLGVLLIERPSGHALLPAEIDRLQGLALQAAVGLQFSLHTIDERWRTQQLALVRQVSLQILNLRDLDEIARRVTRLIQETFDFYYVAVFTLQPGQALLQFRASAGPRPVAPAVRVGEGMVGWVAQTGQELIAGDVRRQPRYQRLPALPHTRGEASLPLVAQDRLLGVMDVQSSKRDDFDEIDMLVLRALADSIAIAIENAGLYSDLSRRAGQLEAVYAVSSAITSILDQDQLLNEVVNLLQARFGYPYVHVYTVHPGRRKVFYEAGTYGEALRQQEFAYDLDDPLGLVPWVARSGTTALVNDVTQDSRYRRSPVAPDQTRSELVAALTFGQEVLGVLDVHSDRLDAFGEEDRFLFESLADHVAIALRNAMLYRSEVWRRKAADGMREVAGLLSADADLDDVLAAILQELGSTLPLEAAAIWLLEEDHAGDLDRAQLHLASAAGLRTAGLDLEPGLTPDEVLRFNAAPLVVDDSAAWLRQALQSPEPLTRQPGGLYEPLGALLGFPGDYSALAAPLRVGGQMLGVLALVHSTAGRYGGEARALSAAFAAYAAVAIENTRMYEAAHEQAWVSTVLLQVAEATQSLTTLNELLITVTRFTPMLAGVRACLLYILDEDGDFVPTASSELSPEQQAEFERWRFAPGDVPALDHLLADRHPIILHNNEDDRSLMAILKPVMRKAEARSTLEASLPVLVPMVARGEVLGAFVVDYAAGASGMSGKTLDDFFSERLAILQGIAHQTAVAVDNIRLLKSQKEEAYVSVALLQVAQAVVSSNDLAEALGAIVRITPILVGVKRAMIYLWDDAHRVFRLSQAYGLSRDAETRPYLLGEFPLLDAVLIEDMPLALPLWNELSSDENVPQAWTALDPPDLDLVDDYLQNAPALLLAFPLSVKGRVLGVFLVEEPDSLSADGLGPGANRRLRAKRMEIITGISQQAALAVQNDILQREMVEQERLEREMQLAREIQNAFLPQEVPDLPGWDLRVRWRTAREVGGDFYDFFELPGSRLGLLIADVADKGMPAALFMTLVRTLVRATIQETDSPAEVLERVNEIIVPEAPRGMFVTILYAVLDLDTGVLEYANAGHNPGLLLRPAGCQVERTERSGMALGVLEGARLHEHRTTLAPGDYLVLYTDGVTEAFSPQGEPFTEERLLEVLKNGPACAPQPGMENWSAESLLNEIDLSVERFTDGADPSDDLTLLVLKYLG